MNNYRQLVGDAWENFGNELLLSKVPKRRMAERTKKQREFLRACRDGQQAFLTLVKPVYDAHIGETDVNFAQQFTESQFIAPPPDTQEAIWGAYKEVPDELLSSCNFWGYETIRLIDHGLIEPVFLAGALNGESGRGARVIDIALNSDSKKEIDDCVRRILRSMCNFAPRGKRVVFNDYPIGKSYWRWHWAKEMAQHIPLNESAILGVLDEKYYASFAAKMHSGRSYIGMPNVLGGLLLYLQKRNDRMGNKRLGHIIDKISFLSVWKAIEMQTPKINRDEIGIIAATTTE